MSRSVLSFEQNQTTAEYAAELAPTQNMLQHICTFCEAVILYMSGRQRALVLADNDSTCMADNERLFWPTTIACIVKFLRVQT